MAERLGLTTEVRVLPVGTIPPHRDGQGPAGRGPDLGQRPAGRPRRWLMAVERIALLVSLAINLVTLSFFVLQTRYLARQSRSLNRSLEYTAYLKLVDYLNEVNLLLFQDAKVAAVFKELDFIRERLEANQDLSIEKIGLAWLILNRYEAALVGYQLGVIPEGEWAVWTARLAQTSRSRSSARSGTRTSRTSTTPRASRSW